MNNSWDRLGRVDHSTANDEQLPHEVDAIFRIHKGINSNKSVLVDGIVDRIRINRKLTTIRKITVNQPFVEDINSTASSVREFVYSVTNDTSRPGDSYYWAGGGIMDFDIRRSRVKSLHAYCNELMIVYLDKVTDKPMRTENITWVIRVSDIYNYYVYIYPAERGSSLCSNGGNSLFLKAHGGYSQRLMRLESDHFGGNRSRHDFSGRFEFRKPR